MNHLTPIQVSVLLFVQAETKRQLPPTHREISLHFKWSFNAAANCHLLALEKKGFIKTLPRISRGIILTKSGLSFKKGDVI